MKTKELGRDTLRDIVIIILSMIAILAMISCSKQGGPLPEPTPVPVPTPEPKIVTYHTGDNHPVDMVEDPEGNLWIANQLNNSVTKFTEKSGTYTTFQVDNLPSAICYYDGKVFTANWSNMNGTGSVTSIDESGKVNTYRYPQSWGINQCPQAIVVSSDTIYIINTNSITRMNIATKAMTIHEVSKDMRLSKINFFGAGVALDDQKNLWITNADTCSLTKISPSGEMTRYMYQGKVQFLIGLVFDGNSLWTIDFANDGLVKISPISGDMVPFKIAPPKNITATQLPSAIAHRNGFVYSLNDDFSSSYESISKVNVADGTSVTWTIGISQDGYCIVATNDTTCWLADNKTGDIIKVILPK